VIPEAAVEAAARGMAILDDHDGCFLEVDAWNAQEEWEREAHPDSYPGSAIEDCAYWLARSRAALEAALPHLRADSVAALRSWYEERMNEEHATDVVLTEYELGREVGITEGILAAALKVAAK